MYFYQIEVQDIPVYDSDVTVTSLRNGVQISLLRQSI